MSTLEGTEDTLFNRTFWDNDGNIVIAQMPNLPILIWLAATLIKLLITSGKDCFRALTISGDRSV